MKSPALPALKKFSAAKQRRLDELLTKNSNGSITPREQLRLQALVDEAEAVMVANAKLLADFAKQQAPSTSSPAVPVTVWLSPDLAGT